jgi:hypothetical protein
MSKKPIDLDLEEEHGGGVNSQNAYVDTTNYSECIPWESPEKLLVLGGNIYGAPFQWLDFAKMDTIIKAPFSGLVVDIEVNEDLYKIFVKNYGSKSMIFSRAGGQGGLTRKGWKEMMGGTDGLKGMILKTLNRKITGGGVHLG